MFISVRILNHFHEPLLYAVPADWHTKPAIGSIVLVPLRAKTVPALVTEILDTKPASAHFAIKDALYIEKLPDDLRYFNFIKQLAAYHAIEPSQLIGRLKQFLYQKAVDTVTITQPYTTETYVTLSAQQQSISDTIISDITAHVYAPTVLHGVTGSGKTEIYKITMLHALRTGKSVLFLLPEVSLALAFAHRLKKELPTHSPLYSFHSAVGAKEKKLLWNELLAGSPTIIVGVHLPVLLPISNLGLIIVDEEHETGYQEKKHPKLNSKDAAIWRAKLYNIPIILGSATPSVLTLYNVQAKGWRYAQLTQRFQGAFPEIKVVLLTDKTARKNFWISTALYQAIKDRIAKKEQSILFINRRGFSFFVQCKACSFVFQCPSCSVSLTLHDHNQLICHYCGHVQLLASTCPQCKAESADLLKKGIGTQHVVSILQKMFPHARIARADLDTTAQKKQWATTLADMQNGSIDILVGTQTITKGYDFARVTLVGIIWADLNLHFPMFNATETTLQQLIQVAGRAGRKHEHSVVIVQAMEHHDIFNYLNEQLYPNFFKEAITQRAILGYPPCKRLAEIEIKHGTETILELEASRITNQLILRAHDQNYQIQILGPAKPPVHKISSVHIRKIYLKGNDHNHLVALFASLDQSTFKSSLFFTPNPLN